MKKLLISGTLILLLAACYNDKYDKLYPAPATTTTCDTTTIGYAHDIVPILTTYCNISGGCHDATGASTSGYNFTSYSGLARVSSSLLLGDINWVSGHNAMPKNGSKLSSCDINMFTRWVNQGSQNN